MIKKIVKYEKIHVVTTYDDEQYFLPNSQINVFFETIKAQKFIKIGTDIINTSSIKSIKEVKSPPEVTKVPDNLKKSYNLRVKMFEKNLGRPASLTEKNKILLKLQSN